MQLCKHAHIWILECCHHAERTLCSLTATPHSYTTPNLNLRICFLSLNSSVLHMESSNTWGFLTAPYLWHISKVHSCYLSVILPFHPTHGHSTLSWFMFGFCSVKWLSLKALTALTEYLALIHSTHHMVSQQLPVTLVPGEPVPPAGLHGHCTLHTCRQYAYRYKLNK